MRITQLLFGRQPLCRRFFSGKNRLPRIVSVRNKRDLLLLLAREEENLFYLRQPYLTKEQEDRYITNYELPREAALQNVTRRTIYKNVSAVERIQHLTTESKWE